MFCICFIKIDWKYFIKPSCWILFMLMYKITSRILQFTLSDFGRVKRQNTEAYPRDQCGLWGTDFLVCLRIFDLLPFSEWPHGVIHAQNLACCSPGVDGKTGLSKLCFYQITNAETVTGVLLSNACGIFSNMLWKEISSKGAVLHERPYKWLKFTATQKLLRWVSIGKKHCQVVKHLSQSYQWILIL